MLKIKILKSFIDHFQKKGLTSKFRLIKPHTGVAWYFRSEQPSLTIDDSEADDRTALICIYPVLLVKTREKLHNNGSD